MTIPRAVGALALLALVVAPLDADAQGRGRGKGNGGGNARNGNGPAFCRSGEGHPVHGMAWCRAKGWDRVSGGIFGTRDRRDDGRIIVWEPDRRDERDERDERDRDERDRDDRRAEPRIRWPF